MKRMKNLEVGSVVRVPTYCFAPNRSGWNGWTFKTGIVREVGTGKTKKGETVKVYTVEYPLDLYNHTTNKETATKKFVASAVFEQSTKTYEWNLSHKREDFFDEDIIGAEPSYGAETEFLIDNGILVDPES